MTRHVERTTREVALATGVTVHVVEAGQGPPVVLVHGGGKDHGYWRRHLDAFAARHRVIAYSRRYAPPNGNWPPVADYSARTDAADLEALLAALGIERADVVAASIGGVAALFLAVRRPELVRSLVLAEPPVLRWARELPGGAALFDRFLDDAFAPAGALFRQGEDERAMARLIDAFVGEGFLDSLPPARRARVMLGARDWAAQTMSTDPFPELSREVVRTIGAPTLLLTGERTIPIHRLVDDELARLLPRCTRLTVPDASHDLWVDQPTFCLDATLHFLETSGGGW